MIKENEVSDKYSKLTPDEMTVDPDYVEILEKRVKESIEETKKVNY